MDRKMRGEVNSMRPRRRDLSHESPALCCEFYTESTCLPCLRGYEIGEKR